MGRHSNHPPEGATVEKTYDGFQELLGAFADGGIPLLVAVGGPGLGKSRRVRNAVGAKRTLIVRGRKSALDFYTDLYTYKDLPVILDDANDLMSQRLCRDYVSALTETERYKRLDYGTKTKILEEEAVPKFFWTASPVCLIANHWNAHDPVFRALESRAEFVFFDPDWAEVYREVGKWFWDQDIYDYVWERLDVLREPDVRLFVKAYNRKKAKLARMTWQKVIDAHVDDELGLAVRNLLDDSSFPSNKARAMAFNEQTGADRATFYRRLRQVRRYRSVTKPPRIVLGRTVPPDEQRPVDGAVPGEDERMAGKTANGVVCAPRWAADVSAGNGKHGHELVENAAPVLTNHELAESLENV
jgi:hypothetical protein